MVIVLAHAFPVGATLFEPQRGAFGTPPRLARRGPRAFSDWELITPALPGFDGSPPLGEASIDAYVRHVLAQLDGMGVSRAVFGGVSMGGHFAFAVLRQAPERVAGVVLANTRSTPDTTEALEGRRKMLQTVEQQGLGPVADAMVPKLLGKTTLERRPEIVARVRQMILGQKADGIAAAITVLMSRPDSTPLLGGIRVPALVVAGEEDTLTPPAEMERMADAIPGATFVRIPEAGHLSNLENPDAFNQALNAFLATV